MQLIDRYFAAGMECLTENKKKVEPVCAQLLDVLDDAAGKQAVDGLMQHWAALEKLQDHYQQYVRQNGWVIPSAGEESAINARNQAQQQLRAAFDPFFAALHDGLKHLDKIVRQREKQQAEQAQAEGKRGTTDRRTRALKTALEELHQEVKNAELYYQHIHWLQQRFPSAQYEDVTGLCKLATQEEIKEQDYSLNPGRYVGVVIEEDGKSEEEFIEDLLAMNDELLYLNKDAQKLETVIAHNVRHLTGIE